jgi:hypothetical protein
VALSFTPAGDLRLAWPMPSADGIRPLSSPAVVLDAGGRAHAIWAGTGRGTRGLFSAILEAHEPSAGPLATPTPIVRPVQVSEDAPDAAKYSPALALDGNGNGQAVWIDTRDGRSAVYSAAQRADGSWGPGVRLSDPNETISGRPAIAVDAQGNAYAVWQGSVDCGGPTTLVQLSFAEQPAGGTWRPAMPLVVPHDDNRLSDAVVAANGSGEVYVAWGETDRTGYKIYSAYRSPSGQWESPRLAADGKTDSGSTGLSLAVNAQGDAYLTWAENRGRDTFVRFAATR